MSSCFWSSCFFELLFLELLGLRRAVGPGHTVSEALHWFSPAETKKNLCCWFLRNFSSHGPGRNFMAAESGNTQPVVYRSGTERSWESSKNWLKCNSFQGKRFTVFGCLSLSVNVANMNNIVWGRESQLLFIPRQNKASASYVRFWEINVKWDGPLIQVKIKQPDSSTRKYLAGVR